MSVTRNETTVRRLLDEVFNQGDLAIVDELFAEAVVFHRSGDGRPVSDARRRIRLFVAAYRTAFPDLRMRIDDLVVTEDAVTVCWTATGTHTGVLTQPEVNAFGVPPTGRAATWSGITLYRLRDGRITESRSYLNGYALLRQLGLVTGLHPPGAGDTSPSARAG
jgi:steroid delta-isomerase-like uncharacterized protein